MQNPTKTHRFILNNVLHNGHSTIILLDQPQSVSLTHSSLAMHRRWTWLSWGTEACRGGGGFRRCLKTVCECYMFLYRLHLECQNTHSSRRVRLFFRSEDILLILTTSKDCLNWQCLIWRWRHWVGLGFRSGLGSVGLVRIRCWTMYYVYCMKVLTKIEVWGCVCVCGAAGRQAGEQVSMWDMR